MDDIAERVGRTSWCSQACISSDSWWASRSRWFHFIRCWMGNNMTFVLAIRSKGKSQVFTFKVEITGSFQTLKNIEMINRKLIISTRLHYEST